MKRVLSLICVLALAISCLFIFASCGAPNSDPDKALEALKENGVEWAGKDKTVIPGLLKIAGIDDVDCVVSGTGKIDDEYAHITIIYFEDADAASDEWEDVQEYAEKEKDDDAEESDWVCKKSGKMIYYGTKNAIKAAK
ncbi:MAG: hypothetical protein IJ039_07525 [Clostridia bacterium]|nr:hypothetical protein [Clostridia bacterium]